MRGKTAVILFLAISLAHGASAAVDNCKTTDPADAEKCTECISGYGVNYFDGQKSCRPCPALCTACHVTVEDQLKCTACYADSYFFEVSKKLLTCLACSHQHCDKCEHHVGCVQCKANTFLIRQPDPIDGGQSCVSNPLGCKTFAHYTGCEVCQDGWYQRLNYVDIRYKDTYNACEKASDRCEAWESHTGCTKCKTVADKKYYLIGTTFFPDSPARDCYTCSDDCQDCQDIVGCSKCKPNFFLQLPNAKGYRTCQKCDENCADCADNEGCKTCKPGFYREAKESEKVGTCKACKTPTCEICTGYNKCVQCKAGYEFWVDGPEDVTCIQSKETPKSTSTVVIVVIVLAVLLVLAGGIYVAMKCLKAKSGSEYHQDPNSSLS